MWYDDHMRQDDDDLHLAASSDTFLSTLMARNTLPTLRTFLLINYDDDGNDDYFDDNDDNHDEEMTMTRDTHPTFHTLSWHHDDEYDN